MVLFAGADHTILDVLCIELAHYFITLPVFII